MWNIHKMQVFWGRGKQRKAQVWWHASVSPMEWAACEDRWNTRALWSASLAKLVSIMFSEIRLNCQRILALWPQNVASYIKTYSIKTVRWKTIEENIWYRTLGLYMQIHMCMCAYRHIFIYPHENLQAPHAYTRNHCSKQNRDTKELITYDSVCARCPRKNK